MPLIDYEKWTAQAMDKICLQFNLDTDPIYSKRFKGGIKWVGYKLLPAILTISTIIVMFYIFFQIILPKVGFEKTLLTLLILLLWSQGSKL